MVLSIVIYIVFGFNIHAFPHRVACSQASFVFTYNLAILLISQYYCNIVIIVLLQSTQL